jgi:glycosyltransferase involved in cell wall biosynthesis
MKRACPTLWVVSDLYHPEDVSTGHVMTCLAEGLASDADVRIVCGRPSYAHVGVAVPSEEVRNGTVIHRVGLFAFPKDRVALRALNVLSFTLSALWFLARRLQQGDRILCVTNPPTLPSPLARLAGWKAARFFLLVHDVFPETAVAAGKLRAGGLLFGLLSRASAGAYRRAEKVVVLGRDMAKLAAAKRGTAEGVEIIENWADLDEIAPLPKEHSAILAELGWTDKRVIQFSGNLGRTHGVETLVSAARAMAGDMHWRWLFAGFGGKGEIAERAAEDSATIAYLPRQPRTRLPDLLSAADAHVIAFVPGMVGLSVPSRMYNVMAAGRPIIAVADRESELAMTVAENGIGWVVDPSDPAGLVRVLAEEATPDRCAEMGMRARRLAETRFTQERMTELFRASLGLSPS